MEETDIFESRRVCLNSELNPESGFIGVELIFNPVIDDERESIGPFHLLPRNPALLSPKSVTFKCPRLSINKLSGFKSLFFKMID